MDLYRDTLAIIQDRNSPVLVNIDLNFGHFVIPLIVISGIDQNLVEYFVQAGHIFYLFIHNLLIVQNPHIVLNCGC